jgi:hypothetical protein
MMADFDVPDGRPLAERTVEPIDPFGAALAALIRRPLRNTQVLGELGRTEQARVDIPAKPEES